MLKNVPLLFLVLASFAHALYANVETKMVPVGRIIENLTKASARSPNDWRTWLNLGRAHAMAASLESDEIEQRTLRPRAGLVLPPQPAQDGIWFGHQPPMVPFAGKALRSEAHLKAALEAYRKADALQPRNALVLVGLGYLLETTKRRTEAIAQYRAALRLAWAQEKDQKSMLGGSMSGEIASYLKPLLDPKRDAAELAELENILGTLSRMGRLRTPLAIPLETPLSPADAQRASPVWFDADGSGFRRSWTWLQPTAGWLVFAPSGRVHSALQLFGSVTFWLFWRDGYEALSSLDDDGDGAITGTELNGLSVWRDLNSNGVSEEGEVIAVASLGIVSLSCRGSPSVEPGVLTTSAKGVTFADGSTRPTWDLLLRETEPLASRPKGEPRAR